MKRNFNSTLKLSILVCITICISVQVFAQHSQEKLLNDGRNDFDFEIGTWETHLKRLLHPLTGSDEWAEYNGTSVVREVLDGRANLVELKVEGPSGIIEGMSLRLYNPRSGQWTLNFASINSGVLSPPVTGGFKGRRGEFYGQEMYNDKHIFVRFIISEITEDSWRFEQAFSENGGRTWEVNWIAIDTRVDMTD